MEEKELGEQFYELFKDVGQRIQRLNSLNIVEKVKLNEDIKKLNQMLTKIIDEQS